MWLLPHRVKTIHRFFLSSLLRREILKHNAWTFTGDLGSFEIPPMLQFFLKQLLLGNTNIVGVRREAETKKVFGRLLSSAHPEYTDR